MSDPPFRFGGFSSPNYTQVPNEVFDRLAPRLREGELRVLLYLCRQTFGWRREREPYACSLAQLENGTGMSRGACARAGQGLVEKGVITIDRQRSANREYETNAYTLRFAEAPSFDEGGSRRKALPPSHPKSPEVGIQSDQLPIEGKKERKKEGVNLREKETTQLLALRIEDYSPDEWVALCREREANPFLSITALRGYKAPSCTG
jgi:hypothetical protein